MLRGEESENVTETWPKASFDVLRSASWKLKLLEVTGCKVAKQAGMLEMLNATIRIIIAGNPAAI
jgi:hypothetical protein